MKAITTQQMRDLDRLTIEQYVPGEVLMERAGHGLATHVHRLMTAPATRSRAVLLVAGKGNNGGDAFVAARLLAEMEHDVTVLLAAAVDAYSGDARLQFDRMTAVEAIPWRHVPDGGWQDELRRVGSRRCVVVDGVLGTGIAGGARGAAAEAIDFINRVGAHSSVVAIDIPSGMNADTGTAEGPVVTADVTVSMAFPKRGLLMQAATDHVGNLAVVDIGIPPILSDPLPSDLAVTTPSDLQFLLHRRSRRSHKGTYGHVLLIGGSPGYSGAIVMSARAALRSGVGLVTVLAPRGVADGIASQVPQAMVHGGEETDAGLLEGVALEKWSRDKDAFTGILAGPGLGVSRQTQTLVERLLAGSRVPLVLDADALTACANRTFLVKRARCPVVLTPHPGEMGSLLNKPTSAIQADRIATARGVADSTGATVVLKGAGSVVAAKGKPPSVNMTGNPGMAVGGMGDVLAGLLAGFVAQAIDPFDAARAAVYLHGLAGDLAAARRSQLTLTVPDLLDALPDAVCELGRTGSAP